MRTDSSAEGGGASERIAGFSTVQPVGKLVFVRHSKPVVTADVSRALWSLSPEGRSLAAELGERLDLDSDVKVVASTERKAVETAELLGAGPVIVDERLVEIAKPWYPEAEAHARAVADYLSGMRIAEWEPQDEALARFAAVIEDYTRCDAVVVTHGTVLSLWLGHVLAGFDATKFWKRLGMPDAYAINTGSTGLDHLVG